MYLGIDLGTSGVKLLLVDSCGKLINSHAEAYPIYYSNDNWSEQNPIDWWEQTKSGIQILLKDFDKSLIKGISFGGQMHSLVMLDDKNDVIRPAILWNDGRCQNQTDFLNNVIGKDTLVKFTGNIAFAGFTAPKILWVKENEYTNFEKIKMILLPKDYLAFKFSGVFSTDYSDAAGTLLLDVENKKWSKEMCDIVGVSFEQLPRLYESYDVVGTIKKEIAEELGLPCDTKIIAGAGDNAAAAVGTGCVKNGSCNVSLGTSGTVFISNDKYVSDSEIPIHSFNHANGQYHLMGCILSAASCNKWWVEDVLQSNHNLEQADIEQYVGKNNVYFLPYLMGERCPHNDTNAKAAFIGMRSNTTRGELTLSVLEGVAFALKECLEIVENKGINISRATLCGGGAKSLLWANVIANIFNKPLDFVETEQGPGFGAAILAMVGCGEYPSVEEACSNIIKVTKTIYPNDATANLYNDKFIKYKSLYKYLKDFYNN